MCSFCLWIQGCIGSVPGDTNPTPASPPAVISQQRRRRQHLRQWQMTDQGPDIHHCEPSEKNQHSYQIVHRRVVSNDSRTASADALLLEQDPF